MIHPLVIGIVLTDVVAVVLLFAAALRAEPVVRQWAPAAADRRQLTLERNLEAASLLARVGSGFLILSSLALLVALTAVLPSVVPGAMCGTGVVEAAKATWPLVLRGLVLVLLRAWSTLDQLDRTAPRAPLAQVTSAVLLPAAPVAAWAAWLTAQALFRLDGQQVVDCCAAMYAEAAATRAAPQATDAPAIDDLVLFSFGAGVIIVGAGWLQRAATSRTTTVGLGVLAILTLAWTLLAAEVLVEHLAAYHYEVLAHRCPWCLFLPEHRGVGYLTFGALAVAVLEAVTAAVAIVGMATVPIQRVSQTRARSAVRRIAAAVAIFTVAAAAPALGWWWRFGVWL